MFEKVSISISGVGSLYPELDSPLATIKHLEKEEMQELLDLEVYGDLMLRFFDKNGRECDSDLVDRTLAIDLDVYRKIPLKIIVASGDMKANTVEALLKGGLVDVLIIDYSLGKKLYENLKKVGNYENH